VSAQLTAMTGASVLEPAAEVATEHLNAMSRMRPLPWRLCFSYGRVLQTISPWRREG
jgi:fructose-bisphosphate aldolase class 1